MTWGIPLSVSYHFAFSYCSWGSRGKNTEVDSVLDGKASVYNAEDPGSVPGLGRSPGEGIGNPLQYSCLENSTTEEAGGLQSTGWQRVRHD